MSQPPKHGYRVGREVVEMEGAPSTPEEIAEHRQKIEPWLSAVFQSEHLSTLFGSGLTSAVGAAVGGQATSMAPITFGAAFDQVINRHAAESAKAIGRGKPNIEDQFRSALAWLMGLEVSGGTEKEALRTAINQAMSAFLASLIKTERAILYGTTDGSSSGQKAAALLESFLLSFASRAASRERLHIFTTNYDRLIEHGCDLLGLRVIDRFVGTLSPIFRAARIEVDLHYNPPGIRGEPRYLEGVVRLCKLHGSLDWQLNAGTLRRIGFPFGPDKDYKIPENPIETVMIYPNAAKDMETLLFPYAELFRDFSAALCRPNSALVTYGYGFGDDHLNRIIRDMLTIPSTHLVIIAYGDPDKRIASFCESARRPSQISLLQGSHFGALEPLVEHYLPKPAIDTISFRRAELEDRRSGFKLREPVEAATPHALVSETNVTGATPARRRTRNGS